MITTKFNLDDNTKNIIIKILAEEWPLSAKEIFYKIKKISAKNITYQAVFKSINELTNADILTKEGKSYYLNPDWVVDLNKFSVSLLKNYKQKIEKDKIEVGVGQAIKIKDAFSAGKKAAQDAIDSLTRYKEKIQFVLIFSSVYYENDFQGMMKGIKKHTGDTPMLGLTTFGEINNDKYSESLVVVVFAGNEKNFSVKTSKIDLNGKTEKPLVNDNDNFGFLFLPGPSQSNNLANIAPSFLENFKKYLPRDFPIIGGVAADDARLIKTYLFQDYKTYSDCAVFASVKTKIPFSITAEHGYKKHDHKEFLLRLDDLGIESIAIINKEDKIKYENSIKVYANETGIEINKLKEVMPYFRGPSNYDNWPRLLALAKKSSPHLLNFPFDIKDDSLIFTGDLKENKPMIMMEANPSSLIKALNSSVSKAREKIRKSSIILVIPCAVYNAVVPTLKNEIKQLKSLVKDIPVVGAYVNGEIGPYDEKNVNFCNGSVTCLVLGNDF